MKKKWEKPELQDLSLKETKGGPIYDVTADGDTVWDETGNKWWTPSGHS